MTAVLIDATVRTQIASFVDAIVWVYSLLIIAYILSQLFFGFGGRVPYNRTSNAILEFLRDTVDPYLRIFRRFIPPIGPLDISPIVAIFVLRIVGSIVVNIIHG